MTLIFATNNRHKVREVQSAVGNRLHIISLEEAGIHIDIPEPFDTLEANASQKSRTIQQLTQMDCFSEDSGLEVTALDGEPGVSSAHYAGSDRSFQANMNKLLMKLLAATDRSARFRTVISLLLDGKEYIFEGICKGNITEEKRGSQGFGYDPIFVPEGSTKTFAEMTMDEKNAFSHRHKASLKLIEFLQQTAAV